MGSEMCIRDSTATPARCRAALYGIRCLSVRAAKWSLYVSRARHLSACLFYVLASGAIIAAPTANSRRLSQQNPYKTCVSLVELGRTSRHFIVHFEKIPTKQFPGYRHCGVCGSDPIPGESFCWDFFEMYYKMTGSSAKLDQ